MGTFDEVFQVDESLEYISQRRAGRAHNEYLEVAIEAGAVGLAVIAGWALWVAFGTWRALSSLHRWPASAGGGILLAMALQSVLDFPMRNQTMLCLGAFALLLISSQHKAKPKDMAIIAEAKL
jgi:O-antigen ligase